MGSIIIKGKRLHIEVRVHVAGIVQSRISQRI